MGVLNACYKVFLYSDQFGYDPTFKFPPFRTYFGSLCTLCMLFFMVIYIMMTIQTFMFGAPLMTQRVGSTSELAMAVIKEELRIPNIGLAKIVGGELQNFQSHPLTFNLDVKFEQLLRKEKLSSSPEDLGLELIQIKDNDKLAPTEEDVAKLRTVEGVMSFKPSRQAYVEGTISDPSFQALHISVSCVDAQSPDGVDRCNDGNIWVDNLQTSGDGYSKTPPHEALRLFLPNGYDKAENEAKLPFETLDIPLRSGVVTYVDVNYRQVNDYFPSRFFPWGDTVGKAEFMGVNINRGDSIRPSNARSQLEVKLLPGGRRDADAPFELLGGRMLVSVLVQMDKDFTTRTYTYYGLLTMLAHWGAIASFLFITFGITAMNFNKLFFMAQLGERDMQKMQKDNFDSHGRLRVKTFQVPAEAEQRKGEPLKEADMAMGYV